MTNVGARSTSATPFVGVVPFTEEDAAFFFGRTSDCRILAANLSAEPLTLVYGDAGVGRTSLLRAGVAPSVRRRPVDDEDGPRIAVAVVSSWSHNPLAAVAAAVRASVDSESSDLPPETDGLAGTLEACADRIKGRLLVVLDDFEEYFLYHGDEYGDGTLASELPRAINDRATRTNFLIAIREDALAKLDRFKGNIPGLFDNYLRIDHLDRTQAREAIVRPIERFNMLNAGRVAAITVEPDLVDAVLEAVRRGSVEIGVVGEPSDDSAARFEPAFLQLAMFRLWAEETGVGSSVLRRQTLERLGGAQGLVSSHVDDTLAGLSRAERRATADIFRFLVTPSGMTIAHSADDLAELTAVQPEVVMSTLEQLARARILRPVAPPPGHDDQLVYSVFHEALAAPILDWSARRRPHRESADTPEWVARQIARLRVTVIVLAALLVVVTVIAVAALGR
jgi:hypothetical protein